MNFIPWKRGIVAVALALCVLPGTVTAATASQDLPSCSGIYARCHLAVLNGDFAKASKVDWDGLQTHTTFMTYWGVSRRDQEGVYMGDAAGMAGSLGMPGDMATQSLDVPRLVPDMGVIQRFILSFKAAEARNGQSRLVARLVETDVDDRPLRVLGSTTLNIRGSDLRTFELAVDASRAGAPQRVRIEFEHAGAEGEAIAVDDVSLDRDPSA